MKYEIEDVCRIMTMIADKMKENLDILANLDGLSGDGDLGESMGKSANAIADAANTVDYKNIGELLMKTSMSMNKAAPSTLGTLLASAVMAAAKEAKGKEELYPEDIVNIPRIMALAIKDKGKAELDDKTILDALIPMSEVIVTEFKKGTDIKTCFHRGAIAAKIGAESTRGMIPKAGRAQWIGERVKDHLDAGAALCAIIAELFILEE